MYNSLAVAKKIFNIVFTVFLCFIVLYPVSSVVYAKIVNKPVIIFGYSFHLVVTDSMSPTIEPGELVVARTTEIADVKPGDNVVFLRKTGVLAGEYIIHNVEKVETVDGKITLTTRGENPLATVDEEKVTEIVGREVAVSAFLGKLVLFLSKWYNLLFIALFIVMIYVTVSLLKSLRKEK